ncbi:beta-ketoacyl-ACP synthase II [Lacticaseibacillus baoqingensis]|uniref:3-oxoacyl-[acyl-carrier-protein] synthase 2 n=1 Tax=Lacticaseibacillus baoqingensis TaxID=2486013 RepID=A0ABW4E6R8_9LACO|nr:beta-ketoacyl-ACP synthase II [Lacticaseibacillus baoqingensis]
MQRVVITGMGTVNALGQNVAQSVAAMQAGTLGIQPIKQFDASATGIHVAGEVADFEPTKRLDKKLAKRLDRFTQFALYSAIEAAEQAGLATAVDPQRLAVIYGSGIGGLSTIEAQVTKKNAKGPKRISPLFVPMAIINMAPGVLAQYFGAHAESYAVVTACASGTSAIAQAVQCLQAGRADMVITGGAEASINEIGIGGFAALTALSAADTPQTASLPFGQDRSGFVMGEGAGTLILETQAHAEARGAQILGYVLGYGATSDAYHMTAPDPSGQYAAKAMQQALATSGLTPDAVGYVNAHGTATVANDLMEAKAIRTVFGQQPVAVSSTKGMTGHLLGAAGALEAILTIAALNAARLPVNLGGVPDAACDVDLVTGLDQKPQTPFALSNSFGFGGHNAVLALGGAQAFG